MISFENLLILSVYLGSLFSIAFYGYYREKYIKSDYDNNSWIMWIKWIML